MGKVGAPIGNKNAEKWTQATVLERLGVMRDMAIADTYRTIGKLCLDNELSPYNWSEWANKFKEDKIVSKAIKEIERICEANLVEQAMDGNANSTMAIFTLKNKHGWKDKMETENTTDMTIKIPGFDWANK